MNKFSTFEFLFLAKDHLLFSYSQQGRHEWRSTGLYAKAAQKVKYTIPEAAVGKMKVSECPMT